MLPMKPPTTYSSSLLFVFLLIIILSCFRPSHSLGLNGFLRCLDDLGVSGLVYTPKNSSYSTILNASIDNQRFTAPWTPKPFIIVTPEREIHIQAAVLCSKKNGIQIRIRGGGHDFEGLSYRSVKHDPFVLIDLFQMSEIKINVTEGTAWVGAGATLGQLYYAVSEASPTLAFPGGFCPTVGVGGHFSGGGYGQLFRQYGMAADHVIDVRLINVDGEVLDREKMGDDLFWALRGGGGGNFGVVAAWKVSLVYVPPIGTYFTVNRTLDQNLTGILETYQSVAPYLPNETYFMVTLQSVNSSGPSAKTIQGTFIALYSGGVNEFLEILTQEFPEIGATREDCVEVSWIQSLLVFNGYPADTPTQVLASRTPPDPPLAYKRKSDYVQQPITSSGLEGIWNYLYEAETLTQVLFTVSGGIMYDIPPSAIPYPHRAGFLFEILYSTFWDESQVESSDKYMRLIRELYNYMTPYVSKSPRAAYVNYVDLDLGVDGEGQIPTWGFQYYGQNFIKLLEVKTRVDPDNFFRYEQSIPTIPLNGEGMKGSSNLLMVTSA